MEATQSAGNHMSLAQYFNALLRVSHNLKTTRSRHKTRKMALVSRNLNIRCKAKYMLISLINLKYEPYPVKLEEKPYTRPLY